MKHERFVFAQVLFLDATAMDAINFKDTKGKMHV